MSLSVRHVGVWKEPKKVLVRSAGIWKEAVEVYVKSGGVWKLVYVNTIPFLFDYNSLNQTILLSSVISPSSGDSFEITIESGMTLSGPSGGAGAAGATGNAGHPNGYTGSAGGAGGAAIDLTGFSGKSVTFVNNGTLLGGNGGTGGRGGNAYSSRCNFGYVGVTRLGYGGGGGAGGAGSTALSNTSGVTLTTTGNALQTGSNGSGGANGSNATYVLSCSWNSCFTAGQYVLMADGTSKAIEDVTVGEYVLDAYSQPQEVLFLDRPLRGDRTIWSIDDRIFTTDEHPVMKGDRTGFAVLNFEAWEHDKNTPHTVFDGEGNPHEIRLVSSSQERTDVIQLEPGVSIATVEGQQTVASVTDSGQSDALLYNLVIAGSGTYYVNGVAVSGHSNDERFDYANGCLREEN